MTNTLTALTSDQTSAIHAVAYDTGRSGRAMDEATGNALAIVQANGGVGQDVVRDTFQVGYMAGYMAKKGASKATAALLEEALVMRFAANCNATTVKEGKPQRGPAWELAYASSRKTWERILKAANLKTTATQGGARERDTEKPDGEAVEASDVNVTKPREPNVPKVADRKAANTWLAQETARLLAFVISNADHVSGDAARVVEAFRKDLLAKLVD